MNGLDLRPVLPAAIMAIAGFAILLLGAFAPTQDRSRSRNVTLFALVLALLAVLRADASAQMGGTLFGDKYALYLEGAILCIAILAAILSNERLAEDLVAPHEFFGLFCFSIVGCLGLVTAGEAISMFVALEIMSVALYALCAMSRTGARRQEAGIKYFITGSFASAFLLFGIALLYGQSGSTTLTRMGNAITTAEPLGLMGVALLLVGFAFKVGAAPFHMWTPDVYQGAPTHVTAFMSAAVKIAAFGALGRVAITAIPAAEPSWGPGLALVAATTMVLGNLGALAQTDLKRLFAFSSVAHAGYVLAGYVGSAHHSAGVAAVLFYVATYAAVNIGVFGTVVLLRRNGTEPLVVSDLAGLGQRSPALAALVTIFLVSLTGIPVSAGFVGKFNLFSSAVSGGYTGLAVVGVLMSVVSAFYYLRIVVSMYMEEPDYSVDLETGSRLSAGVIALCAAFALGFGLFPGPLVDAAQAAALSLLS